MKKGAKVIGRVVQYPDQSVSCPICEQEFWGYSEIIYCKCGWTFIKSEMPRTHLKVIKFGERLESETDQAEILAKLAQEKKSTPKSTHS